MDGIRQAWSCAVSCLFAGFVGVSVQGANLLANGSFEELDPAGNPVGWRTGDAGIWRVEKGAGVGGTNAMRFDCPDGQWHRAPVQPVSLEPGKRYVYSMKVRHENLAGKIKNTSGVEFCLMGYDKDGRRTCGYYAHGMQGTWTNWYDMCEYILEVPTETTRGEFSLGVRHGIGGRAWFDDVRVEEYVPPRVERLVCSGYRDQAWSGAVRFAAALNLTREETRQLVARFRFRDAQGREVSLPPTRMDAVTAFLETNVTAFAAGEQVVRFELADSKGVSLGRAERTFTRLAARPKELQVWTDEYGRYQVNGRAFFPLLVSVEKPTPEKLARARALGANTVLVRTGMDEACWNYCQWNGLKVIVGMNDLYAGERTTVKKGFRTYEDQVNYITNRVVKSLGRPALLGWYLNDEPRLIRAPKMVRQQKLFERLDPAHPTSSCFDHPEFVRGFLDGFDVCAIDPYPIGRWPVSQVSDWLVALRAGATGVKPFMQTVQVFDWKWFGMGKSMPTPHFPTPGEMRSVFWQAIAGGASAIWAWGYNHYGDDVCKADSARNAEQLRAAMTEIRRHLPVFLSVDAAVRVEVPPQSKLLTRSWRLGDDTFVLVVNALGEGARATLALSESFARGWTEVGSGVDLRGGNALEVCLEPLGFALLHLTGGTRHLVLVGDSLLDRRGETVCSGRGSWGERLRMRVAGDVEIVNVAQGGTSTRTFRQEDRWYRALARTRPGDRVIISFGHNDSSLHKPDRAVTPADYKANLRQFVAEVRARGAEVVLVTPVACCTFAKDGTYLDGRNLAAYVASMREVSRDADAPLVDLNARTLEEVCRLGSEGAKGFYMISVDGKDTTHTTHAGSERVAALFLDEAARRSVLSGWFK